MNIKNYCVEKGMGKPLILLHGNNEDGEYFVNQIDVFAKSYRVIAVDTRGHGKTERGEAPFTIAQFADDLKSFMDDKNIDKADIIGFSDGGNIAIVFAMKYPEYVDKLVLNGANLYGAGVKEWVQWPTVMAYHFAKLIGNKKTEEMLGLMVNDPALKEDDLKLIKSKTLVIAGTNDMIKTSHTKKIAESISDSRLAFVKGDHFIARNNPEEFNKAVMAFLMEEK